MPELTVTDTGLVHGTIAGWFEEGIILGLPGTDYRLYLRMDPAPAIPRLPLNSSIRGTIHAHAKRVDPVRAGGRFIEPVYGRPRHIQGIITAIDLRANVITVQSACLWVCTLLVEQRAGDLSVKQLVGFDIESGATLTPLAEGADRLGGAPPQDVVDDHSDPTPSGHDPTQGHQGPLHDAVPGPVINDAGALCTQREITGMEPPFADFPISEIKKKK